MLFFKIIINVTILIFIFKTVELLWSVISFKLNYKKHYKQKTKFILNDDNYKGKVVLCVLLDHNVPDCNYIADQYKDILQGYKNVHVIFITNEQEEIEIKVKHNDEKTTREEMNKYVEGINQKLERRDAAMLIHYPYDNDNKGAMVDFAIKEFMLKYQTIEKISSYVGVFNGSSIVERAFITRFEKTITRYNNPKVIEPVNIRISKSNKLNKVKQCLCYIHNEYETIRSINKNIFWTNIKNILHINRIIPYHCDFNGVLIRLDIFQEEEMLGTAISYDSIVANYYLKNADRQTMYSEIDSDVFDKTLDMDQDLENEYLKYHNIKGQAKVVSKYRLLRGFRKPLLNFFFNFKMVYKSFTPYFVFISLMILTFGKALSLNLLYAFIISIYSYALISLVVFRVKEKAYNNSLHAFKKMMMRVVALILYPLYLVYRCNGFYDYVTKDMLFKKQKELKRQKEKEKFIKKNELVK
ncbi:MAG: hypothetical protein MJ245_03870 [Clostridia bacterium]|nr:hypothetical protein [Clostridia bacterium]